MKPKVLIVTQCFYPDLGGIEGLMTGLADHAFAEDHPVIVLADRIRTRSKRDAPAKPYVVHRFGGPRPWRRWRKRGALKAILAAHAGSIGGIFADSWKSVEAIPEEAKLPISVLAHGSEFPVDASAEKKRRIEAALARASCVIANSHFTAGLTLPYLGGASERLVVIHPPIDPPCEPSAEATRKIRAHLRGFYPIIVTLARLEPRKGIDFVIEAMPEVIRQHPKALYAVAGAGGDLARLQGLVKDLGVEGHVDFTGLLFGEDKYALLESADVFAMPSRREGNSVEGFGIAYLEAAYFGVPALAGRSGGAGEAVVDGETGLLCESHDKNEVKAGLLALLNDDDLRARLGAAAQRRAHDECLWPSVICRYLSTLSAPR